MAEAEGAFSDVRRACRAHTAVPSTLRCAYATTSKALLCDTAVYALGLLVRGCLIVSYSKVHEHAVGPLKRAIKAFEYTGPASPFLAKMQRGAEDATGGQFWGNA